MEIAIAKYSLHMIVWCNCIWVHCLSWITSLLAPGATVWCLVARDSRTATSLLAAVPGWKLCNACSGWIQWRKSLRLDLAVKSYFVTSGAKCLVWSDALLQCNADASLQCMAKEWCNDGRRAVKRSHLYCNVYWYQFNIFHLYYNLTWAETSVLAYI